MGHGFQHVLGTNLHRKAQYIKDQHCGVRLVLVMYNGFQHCAGSIHMVRWQLHRTCAISLASTRRYSTCSSSCTRACESLAALVCSPEFTSFAGISLGVVI